MISTVGYSESSVLLTPALARDRKYAESCVVCSKIAYHCRTLHTLGRPEGHAVEDGASDHHDNKHGYTGLQGMSGHSQYFLLPISMSGIRNDPQGVPHTSVSGFTD